MARLLKQLEEQLIAAEAELQKAEKKVVTCKERVSEIKKQIEDRDMRQAHTLLKQNGVKKWDKIFFVSCPYSL